MIRDLTFVARVVGYCQYHSASRTLSRRSSEFSNQDLTTENGKRLSSIQDHFNRMGVQFSFGYGSGVIPQAGYNSSSAPQLDLIHVVEDSIEFHRANAAKFPSHYSSIIRLSDSALDYVQEYGAGVYFNPYIKIKDGLGEDVVVKYGVVSRKRALDDLQNWTSLYIAGRLQKPVRHIYGISDDLKAANEYNLQSAFNLSLLTTAINDSSLVSPIHLFELITSISYMGDPRMLVGGENPNKVKNIVRNQLPHFEKLYSQAIENAIMQKLLRKQGNSYHITLDIRSAADIVARFPSHFKRSLLSVYKKKYSRLLSQDVTTQDFLNGTGTFSRLDLSMSGHEPSPFICEILRDPSFKTVLSSTISNTVAFPAFAQSIKGIVTAGLGKSLRYAWEKKLKSWAP